MVNRYPPEPQYYGEPIPGAFDPKQPSPFFDIGGLPVRERFHPKPYEFAFGTNHPYHEFQEFLPGTSDVNRDRFDEVYAAALDALDSTIHERGLDDYERLGAKLSAASAAAREDTSHQLSGAEKALFLGAAMTGWSPEFAGARPTVVSNPSPASVVAPQTAPHPDSVLTLVQDRSGTVRTQFLAPFQRYTVGVPLTSTRIGGVVAGLGSVANTVEFIDASDAYHSGPDRAEVLATARVIMGAFLGERPNPLGLDFEFNEGQFLAELSARNFWTTGPASRAEFHLDAAILAAEAASVELTIGPAAITQYMHDRELDNYYTAITQLARGAPVQLGPYPSFIYSELAAPRIYERAAPKPSFASNVEFQVDILTNLALGQAGAEVGEPPDPERTIEALNDALARGANPLAALIAADALLQESGTSDNIEGGP